MNAEIGEFEQVNMFLCVYDLCPVRDPFSAGIQFIGREGGKN